MLGAVKKVLAALVVVAAFAAGWLILDPAARRPAGPPPRDAVPPEAAATALAPEVLARAREAAVFLQVRGVSWLDPKDEEEGAGSGFFVAPDGLIATNWHVVSLSREAGGLRETLKPDKIRVVLRSGRPGQAVLDARLLAADPEADLALLKVEAPSCPFLPLGDSDRLVETAPVWTLGFPLGKAFSVLQRGPEISVNSGHVSALRHDDRGSLDKIQFDAVVQPGNSGGPLFRPDGKVVGITNIAIGDSRVNFAVPVSKLRKLLEEYRPGRRVGEGCRVEITSEPPGAEAYFDSKPLGKTPLAATVAGGYGCLQVVLPGRRSCIRRISLYDGRKVEAVLKEQNPQVFKRGDPAAEPACGGAALERGAELYRQDFSDVRAADSWKQDTGGGDTRTWYVEDGALNQFNADGMLHAIFAGGGRRRDYAFSARVRIQVNENDGRAGLIFRANDDGFALFRLHRRTSQVQLACHAAAPFGWRVLAERRLPFQVQGEKWYEMQVQARGNRVLCLLDGEVVLEAFTDGAPEGGVGFYSVDSQASFREARVTALAGEGPGKAGDATLRSFWFREGFLADPDYLQAYAGSAPAAPWLLVPGGCLHLDADASDRSNMLEGCEVHDADIRSLVSCAAGTVGLVFRGEGKGRYVFAVSPAANRARLLLEEDGRWKELASASCPDDLRAPSAGTFLLNVSARGDRLQAGVNNKMFLDAGDGTLTRGRVGLYADKARAMFHFLQASSPPE